MPRTSIETKTPTEARRQAERSAPDHTRPAPHENDGETLDRMEFTQKKETADYGRVAFSFSKEKIRAERFIAVGTKNGSVYDWEIDAEYEAWPVYTDDWKIRYLLSAIEKKRPWSLAYTQELECLLDPLLQ